MQSFAQTLAHNGLELTRDRTEILQVNVGLACNQACRHCHLEAGPFRREMMDQATAREVAAYAERGGFTSVDITGGAPELNPHTLELVEAVSRGGRRTLFRANLTELASGRYGELLELLVARRVVIMASFPSLNQGQTEAQRGAGVYDRSVQTLRLLNDLGYGQEGSGLELNLISNPAGAFMPPGQAATQERFRRELARKWGLAFNNLYTFANVPLGRFRAWLVAKGGYEAYLGKLAGAFNPCALAGVMCRSLVSINWEGHLYDCDFNLAAGLPLGGRRQHVREMAGPPAAGARIAISEHCYSCTAGAGFT